MFLLLFLWLERWNGNQNNNNKNLPIFIIQFRIMMLIKFISQSVDRKCPVMLSVQELYKNTFYWTTLNESPGYSAWFIQRQNNCMLNTLNSFRKLQCCTWLATLHGLNTTRELETGHLMIVIKQKNINNRKGEKRRKQSKLDYLISMVSHNYTKMCANKVVTKQSAVRTFLVL